MVLTLVIVLVVVFVVLASGGALLVSARSSRRRRQVPPPGRVAPTRPVSPPPPRAPQVGSPPAGVVTPEAPPSPAAPEEAAPAEAGPDGGAAGTALVEAPPPISPELAAPAGLVAPPEPVAPPEVEEAPAVTLGRRPRFRERLGKARSLFADQLAGLLGRSRLDEQAWDDLEEALILADVGVDTTVALLEHLRKTAQEGQLDTPEQLMAALREELVERLEGDRELHRAGPDATTVWIFVGVNGVGKTTTIGKVAMRELAEGRGVVMAAGDTFRAAAADQLQLWSERVGAGFVRGNEGGDPGAVVFDAVQHASARGVPLVLADTAGRLHTKVNLMEELKKVRRVADRPPGSVTEVLLVIDATTGQNGLVQARQFGEAVGVTGVVLTKLDGTAKGGIAVAIASELGVPIKLVGLGEGPEDLVPFDPKEFVEALLG
ncbi:MAG: signal recognition particle-docking protein FtsY [Actinomycetota bacterium]|nr:signal recognition particle-docking protein FtsY [Actinomycetota bacterium]